MFVRNANFNLPAYMNRRWRLVIITGISLKDTAALLYWRP